MVANAQRVKINPKKRRFWRAIRRDRYLYLLLCVPIVYYLLFKYAPMYGVTIAFKDYNIFKGVFGSEWVGFDVFREIFGMKDFGRAVRNTLMLNMLSLLFGFPAPIVIAIMLSELRIAWYKKTTQTLLYLPHFISWMIIAGMAYQMFSTQSGTINHIITSITGGKPVPFLTDQYWWLFVYLGTGIWQGMGWGAILYLAAIAGINPELYEAATVDGCGRLRRIWYITLPGIRPTISILLILNLGRIMTIGFERPYTMGNILVRDFSDVISTFVYRVGILSGQFSIATAVGLFQSVIGLVLIITANQLSKKFGEQGIW
jgi:putative aldouronate transport system permease protein